MGEAEVKPTFDKKPVFEDGKPFTIDKSLTKPIYEEVEEKEVDDGTDA